MAKRPLALEGDPVDVAFFERLLQAHRARAFIRVARLLPSDPRCQICRVPFGGRAGKMMRRFGRGPSRKNPTMCSACFEHAPMGGVKMETGVLFADIRGFTTLAERMSPDEVAELLNRFYASASAVLTRSAIVDKLVGDEVMALYLPALIGDTWVDELVRDANDLLTAVGYGTPDGPWLPLGVGIDVGEAYVGNVGAGEVKDFTALGDVVNTASRLQSAAKAGQIVMSERLFDRLTTPPPGAVAVSLELKGKSEVERARILEPP
jgi:adenylate cyclase